MRTIPYKCQLCGGDGNASYHDDACQNALERFHKMLTCNRCFDAVRCVLEAVESAEVVSRRLCLLRREAGNGGKNAREMLPEAERNARVSYSTIFARLDRVVSKYYQTAPRMDPELVQIAIETPWKSRELIQHFVERGRSIGMPSLVTGGGQ